MNVDTPDDTSFGMDRLPFMLHDFTRYSWTSKLARQVWEPRLNRIVNAWFDIEWLTVAVGIRSCCVILASQERFIKLGAKWARQGLVAVPLEAVSETSAQPRKQTQAQSSPLLRLVIGRANDVSDFETAMESQDDSALGDMLGHPQCCQEFFKNVWQGAGLIDTTWPMSRTNAHHDENPRLIRISSPPQTNILWRGVGLRLVPHLPCSFDCAASVALADKFVQVANDTPYHEEIDWLLEILGWPVEWSALHGIAEIKTPILRIITRTDATAAEYTIQREGIGYPLEGAQGTCFPYRTPQKPILSGSKAFQRGINSANLSSGD